ncbi:Nif3-like dinuclear metal center hexameric protein [Brevibacterium samyangense]|uniref:GTP cyclohydrolase 1 type 2 homolog n=1 Tax=Brevibacterium samyangense TaxID=366888 RepID=A0ABP5EWE0_9MICO
MTHPTVSDVVRACDALWPPEYAESWDTVGLAVGDPTAEVRRILVALDPVDADLDEAIAGGYDFLLTHHPLLLRGVTSVHAGTLKGGAVHALVRAGVAAFNAHTNADSAVGGVSDALADVLDLQDRRPLVGTPGAPEGTGLGRVTTVPAGASATVLSVARTLAAELPPTITGVRIAGDPEAPVSTVAVLGGAGDSLFDAVRASGAEVYVTSDLRHHPATEARDTAARGNGTPHLIDISHWAAESLWLEPAADALSAALDANGFDVGIEVSRTVSDAWTVRIDQGTERTDFTGGAGRE